MRLGSLFLQWAVQQAENEAKYGPPPPEPEETPQDVDRVRADVGLVVALSIEIDPFVNRLENLKTYRGNGFRFRGGFFDGIRVAIVESGPGARKAAEATRALLDGHAPKWVISAGFAGGIVPEVRAGHYLVPSSVARPDGATISIPVPMASAPEQGLHVGKLITIDTIARTVADKERIAAETQGLAVDMETFGVASVCRDTGTHFLSVRIASDDLSRDLPPEIAGILGKTGPMRVGSTLGALVKRPNAWNDLWTLRNSAVEHADKLAKFLDTILPSLHKAFGDR